jgi:hypothetical protein
VIGPQGPSLTAAPTGSRLNIIIGAVRSGATDSEDAMRKHLYTDEEPVRDDHDAGEDDAGATGGLPNRLLTAFEVAEYIGCHEETVRRAYTRLAHVADSACVDAGFTRLTCSTGSKRGAPTRVS